MARQVYLFSSTRLSSFEMSPSMAPKMRRIESRISPAPACSGLLAK